MRRCPRCLIEFDDASRICRFCGGILDEITEPAPKLRAPTAPSSAPPTDDRVVAGDNWSCSRCQETVPGTFTVCWNCGTERSGITGAAASGPHDSSDSGTKGSAHAEPTTATTTAVTLRCAACGSTKIVPNVLVNDQGQGSRGQLRVVIYGNPDAILFKDARYGALTANICGECGQVQLHVGNPGELYEHYLESRK